MKATRALLIDPDNHKTEVIDVARGLELAAKFISHGLKVYLKGNSVIYTDSNPQGAAFSVSGHRFLLHGRSVMLSAGSRAELIAFES